MEPDSYRPGSDVAEVAQGACLESHASEARMMVKVLLGAGSAEVCYVAVIAG